MLGVPSQYLLLKDCHDGPVGLNGLEASGGLYLALNDKLPDLLALSFHLRPIILSMSIGVSLGAKLVKCWTVLVSPRQDQTGADRLAAT